MPKWTDNPFHAASGFELMITEFENSNYDNLTTHTNQWRYLIPHHHAGVLKVTNIWLSGQKVNSSDEKPIMCTEDINKDGNDGRNSSHLCWELEQQGINFNTIINYDNRFILI